MAEGVGVGVAAGAVDDVDDVSLDDEELDELEVLEELVFAQKVLV